MSLNFVTGRAGSGKTEFILSEITRMQNEGFNNLILITPEQFTLEAERQLIRKSGTGAIIYSQALSFGRLAYNIFNEAGRDGRSELTEEGKSIAVCKVITENKDKLVYYGSAADKQGFAQQISQFVSELYSYGVTPDTLANAERALDETASDDITAAKLRDIRLLFSEYKKFLEEEYSVADETLDILYERLPYANSLKNAYIWIDGFYDFTPQQLKVIRRLMRIAKSVTVSFTTEGKPLPQKSVSLYSPFYGVYSAISALKKFAETEKIDLGYFKITPSGARFKNDALKALEKNFFSYNATEKADGEGIEILKVSDAYEECAAVAAKIIYLVREKGMRYRDIAVLTGDLENYGEILASAFYDYGVPFFIDQKDGIDGAAVTKLIKAVADVFNYNFSYESVFAFLKTGLTPVTTEETDILENYVLAYGLKGRDDYSQVWNFGEKSAEFGEKLADINGARVKLVNIFAESAKKLFSQKERTAREFTQILFDILKKIELAETIESKINATENPEEALRIRRTWGVITDVFEKLAEMIGDAKLTFKAYSQIARAGLSEGKLGIIPPTIDNVIIGELTRTRLPEIKALIAVGVNEGAFPPPEPEGGLLTDTERERLNAMGLKIAQSGRIRSAETLFKAYCAITKPSETLILSFPSISPQGKSLKPSNVIEKVREICPNIKTQGYGYDSFSSAAEVFRGIGRILRKKQNGEPIPKSWEEGLKALNGDATLKKRLDLISGALKPVDADKPLDAVALKEKYNDRLYSSVSRLEKYASCPYSYFMEFTLGIKGRTVYEVALPDIGRLFHSVIEGFSLALAGEGKSWFSLDRAYVKKLTESVVKKEAAEIGNRVFLSAATNRYMLKRMNRISERAIWTIARQIQSGKFEPKGFEVEFGGGGGLPELIMETSDNKKIILTGKIDRVDVMDGDGKRYVKIIDYKSGSKAFSLSEVYYGLQLQLLLYMDAYIEYLGGGNDVLPAGAFYFRIKDPLVKTAEEITSDEIERLLFKELKLSGLVLADKEAINGLDAGFERGETKSDIAPVAYKNNGEFAKKGTSVATKEEYERILEYAKKKAIESGEGILSGNIKPSPYRDGEFIFCDYCDYKPVCRFDAENDEIRNLDKMSPEEAMKLICGDKTDEQKTGSA